MAAMVTSISLLASNGSTFTYGVSGTHTPTAPRLLIQSSRVPDANNGNIEMTAKVVYGTVDAEGNVVPSKILFQATSRFPKQGQTADRDAALALFREYVASDEFADHISKQTPAHV